MFDGLVCNKPDEQRLAHAGLTAEQYAGVLRCTAFICIETLVHPGSKLAVQLEIDWLDVGRLDYM